MGVSEQRPPLVKITVKKTIATVLRIVRKISKEPITGVIAKSHISYYSRLTKVIELRETSIRGIAA